MAVALATFLGTLAGCAEAIAWGIAAVGLIPMLLIAAFVAGCLLTAALFVASGQSLR